MTEPAYHRPHELNPLPSTLVQAAALDYAARGWHILPCRPDKKPRIKGWPTAATTDPEQIKAWVRKWPTANIGIVTGERSGLLVLDVDLDKGGFESLEALTSSLPDTYTVRTGGGGAHFYFRYPPGSNIRSTSGEYNGLGSGLDIRGEGGYVIAPPSHTTGPYTVLSDAPLAPPPEWLLEPLRSHPRASASRPPRPNPPHAPVTLTEPIPEGGRNHELTRIAGRLRARGCYDVDLFSSLSAVNDSQCVPPLPAPEVQKIARSVCRYPVGVPAGEAEPDPKTLEALEGVEADLWARYWKGRGGGTDRDVMVILLILARRHGESIPAGPRVEVSYRDLAPLAAISLKTLWKSIKRLKVAGLIRADNFGRLPEMAGAFVLVAAPVGTTAQRVDTPQHFPPPPGGGGDYLSRASATATASATGGERRQTFTAPRLRHPAPGYRRLGKSAGQVVDVLEAAGGSLTLQDLADRTGSKRPRDLRRRTLPRLVEAGVVVVEAGVVALAGDWRESLEVERERAGENAAHRRDAARYEREREAYRRRDETTPEAVPPPLHPLCELERIGPHPVEAEHATTGRGLEEPGVVTSAANTDNTSEGVFSGGGYGPAPATPDRTGQERSVDSGHKRDEQAEESGEAGDSGERESGEDERGEREAWTPSAAYLRMVPADQGWVA
jgi:hypothetical protein